MRIRMITIIRSEITTYIFQQILSLIVVCFELVRKLAFAIMNVIQLSSAAKSPATSSLSVPFYRKIWKIVTISNCLVFRRTDRRFSPSPMGKLQIIKKSTLSFIYTWES